MLPDRSNIWYYECRDTDKGGGHLRAPRGYVLILKSMSWVSHSQITIDGVAQTVFALMSGHRNEWPEQGIGLEHESQMNSILAVMNFACTGAASTRSSSAYGGFKDFDSYITKEVSVVSLHSVLNTAAGSLTLTFRLKKATKRELLFQWLRR